jgi:hypothetical protein
MAARNGGSRIKDFVAYVVIGVACVGIIWLLAMHTGKRGVPPSSTSVNWLGLGAVMAIVFITAIHEHRHAWRSFRFWIAWTSALVVEAALGVVILWNAPRLTAWVWGFLYPVNAGAVDVFIGWWLSDRGLARNGRAAQQGDEADEAFGGTRTR